MKHLTMIFTLFIILFTLSACNDSDLNERDNDTGDAEDLIEFTLDELAQYDGQDGRDAYVAVDGYVYNVTDSDRWIDGIHQGTVQAGQDLTEELDTDSPHGMEMLDRVPKIGIILETSDLDDNDSEANGDVELDNGDDDTYNGDDDTYNGDDDTYNGDDDTYNGDDDAYNGDDDTYNGDDADDTENGDETLRVFTLDELATYDGLDGNDAYIAVDGYVYDVTNSDHWTDGIHQGTIQAGQDLTDEIDEISPHGRRVLDNVPLIGTLEEEELDDSEPSYGGGY